MSVGIIEDPDVVRRALSRVLRAFKDDIRMGVISVLADEDMASFRLLSRRLKINHKKLKKTLKLLLDLEIIEEIQIRVSDGRIYRAYRLNNSIKVVLNTINGNWR